MEETKFEEFESSYFLHKLDRMDDLIAAIEKLTNAVNRFNNPEPCDHNFEPHIKGWGACRICGAVAVDKDLEG